MSTGLNMSPEEKEVALEMANRLSALMREYHPGINLFVLEIALGQQIANIDPLLGVLFEEMMSEYKSKAMRVLDFTSTSEKGKDEN